MPLFGTLGDNIILLYTNRQTMKLQKIIPTYLTLITLTIATILFGNSFVYADEIIMKDGYRLQGVVIKSDDGTIYFKTSYAGEIKVQWQKVSEIISEKPIKILMEDGQTFNTTYIKNTDDGALITKESGDIVHVPENEIAYANPEAWRLGEGSKWTGNINIDLLYERGNTESNEYNADWTTTIRRRNDRVKFWGDYTRETKNKNLTDEDWLINTRYDYFLTKKLFYGAILTVEHDRPADILRRVTTGPLIGYQFFESERMNLDLAVGPRYVNEKFYVAKNRNYSALGWNLNFDHFLIPDRMQFYHRQRGLVQFSDISNLVWNGWTGLNFPVYGGLVFSTEVLLEHDGGAPKEVKKTDISYHIKAGYLW